MAFVDDCPSSDLDDGGSPHLRYLDYSGGTPRRRRVTLAGGRFMTDRYFDSLRVAGRWAAVDARISGSAYGSTTTIVIDLAAGEEAYRVQGPEVEAGWALDADGTLVTVSGSEEPCEGTLAFHTPAEPQPHPLPYRPCSTAIEVDSGRILFAGEAAGRDSLMLGGLDGSAPRPLASVHQAVLRAFDIEGDQAVYGAATCGGAIAIQLVPLADVDPGPPVDPGCPVRLASRRARLRPGGRVSVRLRCPRGCTLNAELLGQPRTRGRQRFRPRLAGAGVGSRGPTARLDFELPARVRGRLPGGVLRARLFLYPRSLLGAAPVISAPLWLRVP